jgi:Ion transport protein
VNGGFCCAASLVDMLSTGSSVKFLRVFRLGRALRPLRVIRGNASMRVVVSSLMSSFTDVLNVYLLSQVVSLMFAIVGVSLFSGLLLRCNNPAATGVHDCVGTFVDVTTGENTSAVWSNPSYGGLNDPPFSFDDILNAFLVVKEVQVTEGWTEVLSATVDITAEDQQPQFNASPMNSLYFVALLTIGTFFVAQLYTGVIVASYSRSDGTAFMTEQQRDWIVAKLTVSDSSLRLLSSVVFCDAWF